MRPDRTDLYTKRPGVQLDNGKFRPVQEVNYTLEPNYYKHQYYEDKLAILVSQIKIWKPENEDWFKVPKDCLIIRECESVEVTDSCKELINKAVVRFPRGTLIPLSSKKENKVRTGTPSDGTASEATLKAATNDGEVISPESSVYANNGVPITSMAMNYDDKGLIEFNRKSGDKEVALLSPNDVAIGQRIEIRLGYAYSETEFKTMNKTLDHPNLSIVFTGFITSISAATPLELECTNMAHVLACISTPNIPAKGTLTVKDFLDDDGKYKLLKDTGIPLAECSKRSNIFVTGGSISDNLTVADVLTAWTKSGVCCIMDILPDGRVQLKVGMTYYAGTAGTDLPNNDKKYITYNGGNNTVKLIQFDWDVADDRLSLKNVDKKYLAVEAQARTKANQYYKVTIRKNPDLDDDGWMAQEGNGDWQVVNVKDLKSVKKAKEINGVNTKKRLVTKIKDKVNLDKYNVIPYFSPTVGISKSALIEEAKQYWAKYNPNGISGTISIFGDVYVKPTDIVGLIDLRFPEKNGYYFVEQVDTTFDLHGYRRELHIPFKMATFKKNIQIID